MLEDGKKILKLFPLPIFHYKVKDYENLYDNDKNGLKRSNQGGWH